MAAFVLKLITQPSRSQPARPPKRLPDKIQRKYDDPEAGDRAEQPGGLHGRSGPRFSRIRLVGNVEWVTRAMAHVLETCKNLTGLVQDLLDYSAVVRGELRSNCKPLPSVLPAALAVVQAYQPVALLNGLTLHSTTGIARCLPARHSHSASPPMTSQRHASDTAAHSTEEDVRSSQFACNGSRHPAASAR